MGEQIGWYFYWVFLKQNKIYNVSMKGKEGTTDNDEGRYIGKINSLVLFTLNIQNSKSYHTNCHFINIAYHHHYHDLR
jgi:hypothetical protein